MHRILAVCLAVTACAAVGTNVPDTKVVEVGTDFGLSPGQTAVLEQGALTVTFVKVNEDSRCPEGVVCVWQGNVATALLLGPSTGDKSPATLHTTLSPQSVSSGAYVIALTGIQPVRKQQGNIPQADYIATFRVTRQ